MILEAGGALAIGLLALVAPLKEARENFLAAARRGDTVAVEAFLKRGMDPNAKSDYGGTALAFASDKGHLEVVRVLLRFKANPNARDSFYQATPITWAVSHEHAAIVKALLDSGASGADAVLMSAVSRGKGCHGPGHPRFGQSQTGILEHGTDHGPRGLSQDCGDAQEGRRQDRRERDEFQARRRHAQVLCGRIRG